MATQSNNTSKAARLQTLLKLLASDPGNVALITDAAEVALAADQPHVAADVLQRHAERATLPPTLINLAGLAALRCGDYDAAALNFERVHAHNRADTSVRFNLAWSLAMQNRGEPALALLDDITTSTLPQAAMLQVQLMHAAGAFDNAMAQAKRHLETHGRHPGLNAVASVLAVDMEDFDLARQCAEDGGDRPEALTTLGTLALADQRYGDASAAFERALGQDQSSPRGWIGKGLAQLAAGRHAEAAQDIERGAALFGDHLGSWIAAGWAHLLAGDQAAAQACFDRTCQIDDTFAEAHGSLAVLALQQNRIDDAKRSARTALRLDQQSFSGALAEALILQTDGHADLARAIIDRALHAPLDASGRTIAQALAKQGLSP